MCASRPSGAPNPGRLRRATACPSCSVFQIWGWIRLSAMDDAAVAAVLAWSSRRWADGHWRCMHMLLGQRNSFLRTNRSAAGGEAAETI